MHSIIWPAGYLPGTTDNFVSNEVISANANLDEVWRHLSTPSLWPSYYHNASQPFIYDAPEQAGVALTAGARFRFVTFGFDVEGEVTELTPPGDGQPGRIAWHGWVEGDEEQRLDVHHAWIVEALSHGRVRVLTQETQNGVPAQQLAAEQPNPMLNAHQAWQLAGAVTSVIRAISISPRSSCVSISVSSIGSIRS